MTKNQKLELTWIGKENRPHLEPRILLEDPEKSYHASHRVTDYVACRMSRCGGTIVARYTGSIEVQRCISAK
jgi:hypothetical protein